ncbi:MAG: ATPase domain-containing protein [Planctomycetota bacterium]|jgi:twinkle protein
MITAADVKQRLHGQIESVAAHLLPGGKRKGKEWEAGDIHGSAGQSLKLCMTGSKTGLWKDFAGESEEKGDIFSLWMKVKDIGFKEAFEEACKFVGMTEVRPAIVKEKPTRPAESEQAICPVSNTAVQKYLNDERLISDKTLIKYKVRAFDHDMRQQVEGPGGPTGKDWIAFRWEDSEGDLVTIKTTSIHRNPNNGKKQIWSTDPYQTLWGWWLVKDTDREIVICEGEIDAMTLSQLGCHLPVLSVPSGSSNLDWIDNDYLRLQRFERIYICADQDPAGTAMAASAATRLGLSRTFSLPLPSNAYKDPNDVLREGNEYHCDPTGWFAKSFTFDPPTIQTAREQLDGLKALIAKARNKEPSSFIFPEMDFEFRRGETTLLSGYPGSGKSQFLYQLFYDAIQRGEKCLLCSYEIAPSKMLRGMIRFIFGETPTDEELEEFMDTIDGSLWFLNPKKPVNVDDLWRDIDYCHSRFGVEWVGVDSLHFMTQKDNYNAQDEIADQLHEIGMELQIVPIMVCHANVKKKGIDFPPGMEEVEGSGGVARPGENGISIWRNSIKQKKIDDAEEINDQAAIDKAADLPDAKIVFWKQREGSGWLGRRSLWFDKEKHEFRSTKTKVNPDAESASLF